MYYLIQRALRAFSSFAAENRTVLASLALLCLVEKTFVRCLENGFVNWDDNEYVFLNLRVKSGLTMDNLLWAFRSPLGANWHPVTMISHMLDYQLYGGQPWGHHLSSLVLHCATAVMVFLLFKQVSGTFWRSWFLAAFFSLHPLRVESVAWVAERKDVLSTFFWMLTLLTYSVYVARAEAKLPKAKLFYGLSLLTAALGLMSKSMLVTIPLTLFLLDYWPLGRWRKERWPGLIREKIPFVCLSGIVAAVTCVTQSEAMYPIQKMTLGIRLANMPISYCRYLGKIFCPINLATYYPYPVHWPALYVSLAILLLAGISLVVFRCIKSYPFVLFGWLWFLGTLVPVIGLVQVGSQSIADRYSYVPSLGILVIAIWGLYEICLRFHLPAALGWSAAGLAAAACVIQTRQQISYWKTDYALFQHAAAVTQDNYIALFHMANHDLVVSNYDSAISNLTQVITIKPGLVPARIALGDAFIKQGRPEKAVQTLQPATRIQPTNIDVYLVLARAQAADGRPDAAITNLMRAEQLQPGSPQVQAGWRAFSNSLPHNTLSGNNPEKPSPTNPHH